MYFIHYFPYKVSSISLSCIITGCNEVVAKVMFLLMSVILFTGGRGYLPQCMLGYHTPLEQTPPEQTPPWEQTHPLGADTPPWEQTHPPGSRHPQSRHPPPPGADTPIQSRHTPLEQTPPGSRHPPERPVRILLECILVFMFCICLVW